MIDPWILWPAAALCFTIPTLTWWVGYDKGVKAGQAAERNRIVPGSAADVRGALEAIMEAQKHVFVYNEGYRSEATCTHIEGLKQHLSVAERALVKVAIEEAA